MNRKIVLIGGAFLGLLLGITTLLLLTRANGGVKVSVSFLKAEPSHGEFPTYAEGERLDFAARNAGSRSASVYACGIQDENGQLVPTLLRNLGDVEARQSAQLNLYLPLGLHPRSVRMRVYERASLAQKTQTALRLLVDKAAGRYAGNQVWFGGLSVPAYEFIVSLRNEAEPKNRANDEGRAHVHP